MAEQNKTDVFTLLAQASARNTALGFVLTGVLMGSLGSLAVSWRYQVDKDPRAIGFHFFAFDAALLIGGLLSQRLIPRRFLRALSVFASLLACAAFVGLAFAPLSAQVYWRLSGVALLGLSAGALFSSLFRLVRPFYDRHAAPAMILCGSAFGIGCFLASLIVAATYDLTSFPFETVALAAVPLLLAFFLKGISFTAKPTVSAVPQRALFQQSSISSFGVALFALLLFFQFGNEWALASWLPLLFIHRLGMNPQLAIFLLGLFFLALTAGRLLALPGRRYASHTKLLFASVSVAMLGYLLLSLTASPFGAALATVVTGLALGPVYALTLEKIGRRYDLQPGFFRNIFSCAIAGGMLVPWLLGFVAYAFGMQYVLIVPAFGSIAVFALMLLLVLEAKLTVRTREELPKPEPLKQQSLPNNPKRKTNAKAMAAGAGKRS